jgi:hypothetical protein
LLGAAASALPVYRFFVLPPESRHLASTYRSNFSQLLFKEGDVDARQRDLKVSLEFRNVSQETLRNLSVQYNAVSLNDNPMTEVRPYASAKVRGGLTAGTVRAYLEPRDTWRVDLTFLLDKDLVTGLFSIFGSTDGRGRLPLRPPDTEGRTHLPFNSTDALAYMVRFGSVEGSGVERSAQFGTLIWALIAYDAGNNHIESLYFGGCFTALGLRAAGSNATAPITASGTAQDFVIRMPYTIVRDDRWRVREVYAAMNTDLELDLPNNPRVGGGAIVVGPMELEEGSGRVLMGPIVHTNKAFREHGINFVSEDR